MIAKMTFYISISNPASGQFYKDKPDSNQEAQLQHEP